MTLGSGRTARALSVGYSHSCVSLDDGTLRCWGFGGSGRLGYGDESSVGDSPVRSVALAGPVPVAGSVPPLVADLSLSIGAATGEVHSGGSAVLVITASNGGVDTTQSVGVALPVPDGVAVGAVSATQGSFTPGAWRVGSLAPGMTATLRVPVRMTASGVYTVNAQVAASSLYDPDSTPGNGPTGEDDEGAVTLVVPSVQAVPPPAPRMVRSLPRALRISAVRRPRRGVARRIDVSGVLVLPRVRPAPRCAGRVQVRAAVGRRTVGVRTAPLRLRAGVCRYATLLRPRRTGAARTVVVSARFLGTVQMRPRSSTRLRVRNR